MITRIIDLFKYQIERFLLGGAQNRLLFIALLLLLASVGGGLLVRTVDPALGGYSDSIWWAFLRLSDPGYLGDDTGVAKRTLATVITLLGYVLFMGALVAIMTQWLHSTIRKLESGLTPITKNDHILILGWTNRTPSVIREILSSGNRLKRFLKRLDRGAAQIVVLAPEVGPELSIELKEFLGPYWNPAQITFRSGIPIRIEDLKRVDFLHASVIILPGKGSYENAIESIDAGTIKSLMSISNLAEAEEKEIPPIVTEIMDSRRISVAEKAYHGEIEVISSNSIISRLICQTIRHPGLSYVCTELLTQEHGHGIHLRKSSQMTGKTWGEVALSYEGAVPIGVLRRARTKKEALFCPDLDYKIANSDFVIFISPSFDATKDTVEPPPAPADSPTIGTLGHEAISQRVLILGWSQKVPFLLEELAGYTEENYQVDIISVISPEERIRVLSRYGLRTEVKHIEADYTLPNGLRDCPPENYDFILFLASDWVQSGEETDARSILGYLLLQDSMIHLEDKPEILVELVDPDNENLFAKREGEVIISPRIVSHLMGSVALRPDLNLVFNALFESGGAEFNFHKPAHYQINTSMTFREIQQRVLATGRVATGIRRDRENKYDSGILLNPSPDAVFDLGESDDILVLRV